MPNYQNGKIYKLVSFQTDKIYIGSTCQSLAVRKAGHKDSYKRYLNGQGYSTTSFELIKHGDVDIILLENYSCDSKEELHKRERYYIECNDCVNKIIPTRTQQEYYKDNQERLKEYREQNKDRIKENREKNKEKLEEYMKEYRQQNKSKIQVKTKEYNKIYRVKNENKIKEYKQKYYEQKKDEINENKRKVITCSCGATITQSCKSRHEKTQKHLKSLK
jgi:hypothetical protein